LSSFPHLVEVEPIWPTPCKALEGKNIKDLLSNIAQAVLPRTWGAGVAAEMVVVLPPRRPRRGEEGRAKENLI